MKLDMAFKRRCEAISVDWRHRLGLRVYDPLPSLRLLNELNGQAISPDQMTNIAPETTQKLLCNNDWSAAILRLQPLLIVYHPLHSLARREASLMHEIGHVLLQHPMVGFDKLSGLPIRNLRHEDEAIYLGSCLQIPRLGLEWFIKKNHDLPTIAKHFGASEELVKFRRNLTVLHRGIVDNSK